jgi:hypothetical protein
MHVIAGISLLFDPRLYTEFPTQTSLPNLGRSRVLSVKIKIQLGFANQPKGITTMNEKIQEALAMAYRAAVGKTRKLKEVDITPDMDKDAINAKIEEFAKAKAEKSGKVWTKEVAGQRWYVEHLVEFSKMSAQERVDFEYSQAFPDVASEDTMVSELEALMAK